MGSVAKVPEWTLLWSMYYDYIYFPDSNQVKKMIGGKVDASWITNTCAVRLSDAFNWSGIQLPSNFSGMVTIADKDKNRIAIRVRELRKWMLFRLGDPDFTTRKKAGDDFDKTSLSSKKGIIEFKIAFSDATGHLDLWDGSRFSSEPSLTKDYWKSASEIHLWECGK